MMTQRRRSGKLRPIHSPSSETVNEQLRRAESLPTDTREYMQDIHSVQGERGEGARVTGRGRESTKGQANDSSDIILFPTVFITHFATVTTWIDVEAAMMRISTT